METVKLILTGKKVFDYIEKHGWKRVSGAMCVAIISVFIGIGYADVAHVWSNGQSISMEQLHLAYLWELTVMFAIVYFLKHFIPHGIRIVILLLFKNDPEAILKFFMEAVKTTEPTTGGAADNRSPPLPQTG